MEVTTSLMDMLYPSFNLTRDTCPFLLKHCCFPCWGLSWNDFFWKACLQTLKTGCTHSPVYWWVCLLDDIVRMINCLI